MTKPNLEELKAQLAGVEAKVDELLVQIKKITAASSLRGAPSKGTLEECKAYAVTRDEHAWMGEVFFDQMEAQGWCRGHGKIALKDWRAHFRVMAKNGWLMRDRGAMRIAL